MFTGSWSISVEPTAEPLTLDEVRLHLLESGTERDNTTSAYMKAARIALETWSCRQFMKATWVLKLDEFPTDTYIPGSRCGQILLPRPPLQSVTSVAYTDSDGDTQTVATSVYGVDTTSEPGRVYLKDGQSWPSDILSQPQQITITYVAGYSDSATVSTQRAAVPETVKQAIRLQTESYFDMGGGDLKVVPGMGLQSPVTNAVQSLLWSFRVVEFA